MTMYKRFSVIMFLVLFLSLFISTTMKFHFVVGILWILCTCTLFLYVPLRFQQEVPAFQKYVAWIKSGGKKKKKKYISDYWNISTYRQKLTMVKEEGVPTYWHTLVFHND